MQGSETRLVLISQLGNALVYFLDVFVDFFLQRISGFFGFF
jgi:hypothetical protein